MLLKELYNLSEAVKKSPEVSINIDHEGGTIEGSIWLDVESKKEFEAILNDPNNAWTKLITKKLNKKNISLSDISDRSFEMVEGGCIMYFDLPYED